MPQDPTSAMVRAELERVLASDGFVNSERLSRFLCFTVEKTLAAEADQLKEYLLGVEVFDRGAAFDPRMDPIVRVEARRLRAKLDEYNAGAGHESEVRIVCRKGSYVPTFEASAPELVPAVRRPMRRAAWWLAAVGLALGVGYWAWSRTGGHADALSIAVLPMDAIAADRGGSDLADGVAEALSVELARDPAWRVVAWSNVLRYRQEHGHAPARPLQEVARDLNAEMIVALSVEGRDGRARVTALLLDPKSSYKGWSRSYERSTVDGLAMERELAQVIAEELRVQGERRRANGG
jgi:TolB-like protein